MHHLRNIPLQSKRFKTLIAVKVELSVADHVMLMHGVYCTLQVTAQTHRTDVSLIPFLLINIQAVQCVKRFLKLLK